MIAFLWPPPGPALFQWAIFRITPENLSLLLDVSTRLATLVLWLPLLVETFTVQDLSHGFYLLLRPLGRRGTLARGAAMVVTLLFRFIPLLLEEAETIVKAQAARGALLRDPGLGFLQRVRNHLPLVVPIFLGALERAEILAQAMEARYYDPGLPRGSLYSYPWKRGDTLACVLLLTIFLGGLYV